MSPRTGRPKAANPKSVEVKVRFTDSDNQRLLAYSKDVHRFLTHQPCSKEQEA